MLVRRGFASGRWKWWLLLLACWLLAAPGALAQQPAAVAAPPATAPPADTSAAVRRLFAERRGEAGAGRLVASGFLAIFANYSLSYATYETALQSTGAGLTAAVLGYEVFSVAQVLHWRRRYSKAQEQAVLAALAQGQPLPRQLRRRLKAKYFTSQVPAH